MTTFRKSSLAAALLLAFAGTAMAGPQWQFGPNNQGDLQLDYKGQLQMTVRDTGSGPNGDGSTTDVNFRRNRLALMGGYGDSFGLYVQTEYIDQSVVNPLGINNLPTDTQFSMLDAVFRFRQSDALNVNAGKYKYSFSRENLEACENPLTLDRSQFLTAPLLGKNPTRDTGITLWGNLLDAKLQYRLDAMQGRKPASGDESNAGAPKSSLRYGARVHASLLDPEADHGYKGTYLGKKKVLTIGAAVQVEPKAVYSDWKAKTGEKNYSAWTVDGFFEYPLEGAGAMTLSGAYVKYKLGNAYLGANPDPMSVGINGEKNGGYAKAAYMLAGTPLQFFARAERWRFAQLSGVYNQKIDWKGIGANYYIRDQNLKVTVEYSKTDFDKLAVGVRDFKTLVAQLQVIF